MPDADASGMGFTSRSVIAALHMVRVGELIKQSQTFNLCVWLNVSRFLHNVSGLQEISEYVDTPAPFSRFHRPDRCVWVDKNGFALITL